MAWYKLNHAGYSVQFSPFRKDLIAVGTAQFYGIAGNGKIDIFRLVRSGGSRQCVLAAEFPTNHGIYDVAWSEVHDNVLAGACADGSIKVVDVTKSGSPPVLSMVPHQAECNAVDWNIHIKAYICTAGWDNRVTVCDVMKGSIVRQWDFEKTRQPVCYESRWSPAKDGVFASVSGNGYLYVMDALDKRTQPVLSIPAHAHEVLSVDWNKYRQNIIVTGSVDKTLRVWDIRKPAAPVTQLFGHALAVRRVRTHPFSADIVASASYDMSMCLWDISTNEITRRFDHHSEFVVGIDWSLFEENVIATTSWDKSICSWDVGSAPPNPPSSFDRKKTPGIR